MGHFDLLLQAKHKDVSKPLQETIATQDLNDLVKQTALMKHLALYVYYQPRAKKEQISLSLLMALFDQAFHQR